MAIKQVSEEKVREIVRRWGGREGFLVEMLQDVQTEYRYIPEAAIRTLSKEVGVPVGQIYHLATFFKRFSLKPRGEYVISVCTGTACHVKGAPRVLDACARELGISVGETTKDGTFTLEEVRCLGCCGLAAVVTVNDDIHGHVTTSKVPRLLKRYKGTEKASHGEADD
ncbi:MAG: NAD(P)H-dependent oxidoreductase subunit E [Candidatus Sumerlaeia bacterium]|nr:NAD(P)H-dependent oxidoreductase subunit E [Candidatus Sumerlaeia bacterium]